MKCYLMLFRFFFQPRALDELFSNLSLLLVSDSIARMNYLWIVFIPRKGFTRAISLFRLLPLLLDIDDIRGKLEAGATELSQSTRKKLIKLDDKNDEQIERRDSISFHWRIFLYRCASKLISPEPMMSS